MNEMLGDASKYSDLLIEWLIEVVPSIALAIVILVVGWIVAGMVGSMLVKALKKARFDASLIPFLRSLAVNLLKIVVVISAAGVVGIETTSFVAILGAAGLAVGMALQGSLGNFAGGVLILIFKPVRVNEYIEALGYQGTVQEIQIFCTILNTIDNKVVILPNGALAGGAIVNYSRNDTRRVDMTFGIGYSDDIDKAKSIINNVLNSNELVLKTPAPVVVMSALADSSVNFAVRPWVKTADYWTVYSAVHEAIKKEFDKNNVSIPFPQRDVHIFNQGS